MASIQQKFNKFYVVYRTNGSKSKQEYEPFATEQEAVTRKLEIEYLQSRGTFIPSNSQTIREYLETFVEIYGTQNWNVNSYSKNVRVLVNYVYPLIGKIKMKDFKALHADKLMKDLLNTPSIRQNKKGEITYLSPSNVEKIGKLLKTAFNQAEIWELVPKDPFKHTKLPRFEKDERAIWDAKTLQRALELCDDGLLYLCINVAFASTFRAGEMAGLDWAHAFISDEDIENDNARLCVEQQLQRLDREDAKKIRNSKIIFEFPSYQKKKTKTMLALVIPKTKSSKRTVWIPRTLAYILRRWKEVQEENKEFFGKEYYDYNLIFAQTDGRPISPGELNNKFQEFIKKNELPKVVLHSLRHTSTTYKLKLNHGDLKATQGDTGHATPDMILKLYAHILDEDRKVNASKFEDSFYSGLNDANRKNFNVETEIEPESESPAQALLKLIEDNPELRESLSNMLKM